MDTEFFELPFTDEPYDEERARQQEIETDKHFDSWLESLRS